MPKFSARCARALTHMSPLLLSLCSAILRHPLPSHVRSIFNATKVVQSAQLITLASFLFKIDDETSIIVYKAAIRP